MKNKLVYAIVAVAFVGGIFATAYAGPIINTITLAGNVQVDGSLNVDGPISGQTVDNLQTQIDDLQTQIDNIELLDGPPQPPIDFCDEVAVCNNP